MKKQRKRPTIRHVAAAAGVSLTTVSHALNGKGRVDPETVEAIRRVAAKLGYAASTAARSLRTNRTSILAVMHSRSTAHHVSLIELDYFIHLVAGASEAAAARGYHLVLLLPTSEGDLERLHVDGVILIDPTRGDPLLRLLRRRRIGVVTTGRDLDAGEDANSWVDNDNDRATFLILDHLADNGARRVALLTTPSDYSYSRETLKAYHKWCKARGQVSLARELLGSINESLAFSATMEMLRARKRPDAIHCVTDRYAMGALLAARTRGLRVPEDLLITAGTDSDTARLTDPPLTALDLHPRLVGQHAANLLIGQIEGTTRDRSVVVPVEVIVRRSSSPLPHRSKSNKDVVNLRMPGSLAAKVGS